VLVVVRARRTEQDERNGLHPANGLHALIVVVLAIVGSGAVLEICLGEGEVALLCD
jgi:hypothetical protein